MGRQAPEGFSAASLLEMLERRAGEFRPEMLLSMVGMLRRALRNEYFDLDTWKGLWIVLREGAMPTLAALNRRLAATTKWTITALTRASTMP